MSMESQWKTQNYDNWLADLCDGFKTRRSYDIVVLDEIETYKSIFMNHKTHGEHLPENWDCFMHIVKSARKSYVWMLSPIKALV